jgi:hypothetical protein
MKKDGAEATGLLFNVQNGIRIAGGKLRQILGWHAGKASPGQTLVGKSANAVPAGRARWWARAPSPQMAGGKVSMRSRQW